MKADSKDSAKHHLVDFVAFVGLSCRHLNNEGAGQMTAFFYLTLMKMLNEDLRKMIEVFESAYEPHFLEEMPKYMREGPSPALEIVKQIYGDFTEGDSF